MGHKILLNVQFLLMKNRSSYKLQWKKNILSVTLHLWCFDSSFGFLFTTGVCQYHKGIKYIIVVCLCNTLQLCCRIISVLLLLSFTNQNFNWKMLSESVSLNRTLPVSICVWLYFYVFCNTLEVCDVCTAISFHLSYLFVQGSLDI